MERKIGEIFEFDGEWYQCLESIRCDNCDLEGLVDCSTVACSSGERSDGKEVHFKKLKKVGEPYEFQKRTIQTYKLYTEPFISVDMDFIWAYLKGGNTIDIIIKQDIEDMEEKNNGNTPLNVLTDKYVNGDICYDDFEKEVKALYSCKEEIKPTLKEFDLEAAKLGKPVCTRDGHKARIICFDAKDTQPIIGLYEKNIDGIVREYLCSYHTDGRIYDDQDTGYDLMMLPEKKSGWINIYALNTFYSSKEEAEANIDRDYEDKYIGTIEVEWEE